MNNERLKEKFQEYRKAVIKLKEALDEDISNPLIYDGAIRRFEFTYELAWKLMKFYLEYEGTATVTSPRAAFKEAFAAGIIVDGDIWIDMINDRNLTVHTYIEQMAKEIYERVKKKYYPVFAAFAGQDGGGTPMNFGLPEHIMQALIKELQKRENVTRAVIFGSRARGDYKYNSDIDLAVYCEGKLPPGLWLDLDEAAGIYKIDVIDMNGPLDEKLRQRIAEQGVEIYRRS